MKPLREKRHYEKPVMQVHELQGRQQLLAGSGGLGDRDYDPSDINPFGN
ncbi:MAG: hypothetical protein IJJ56_07815 [Prevotella sp.]|nr:hypothetical protein [Prevotella sp.]